METKTGLYVEGWNNEVILIADQCEVNDGDEDGSVCRRLE